MQEALERVLSMLILGPELNPKDSRAVAALLEQCGVAQADRETMLGGGLEELLVYRRLVRATLHEALECSMPRTLARLGPLLQEYFDAFLAEQGPRSQYVRDVPREFLCFCGPRWLRDPRVPPYVMDLGRHEYLRIEVGAMPPATTTEAAPRLELDHGLTFIEASRVVRYAYRVHELPDDPGDRTAPAAGPVALFVYRSAEHVVRYLELTPLAASILDLLRTDGATLRQAVQQACAAHERVLDEAVLTGTARLLSDLAERNALLGARSD